MKTKIKVDRDVVGRFKCTGVVRNKARQIVHEVWCFAKTMAMWTVIAGFFGLCVYGYAMTTVKPKVLEAQVIVDKSSDMFLKKIDDLKNGVVDDVFDCERAGHVESEGIIIFDPKAGETNSKMYPSLGTGQFKPTTVQYYEKFIYGKIVNGYEADLIALDETKAKSLAKDVMFKTKNMASGDWKICAAQTNADQRIIMIKQLEK